jgi:hypothetical protein
VVIAQALIWGGLALASFAGAAALVLAIVRATEDEPRPRRADRRGADGCVPPGTEPQWWPEFERAFSDYVRAGEGRRS